MTEQDFYKLERIYQKAKKLKNVIDKFYFNDKNRGEDYIEARKQFDELDPLSEIISVATHKKFDIGPKIKEVRNLILLKTAGTVNLPDETIIEIIEKSVL